jgi:hypothetical protein
MNPRRLRRFGPALAVSAVLAAGGFAAASIASGGGLRFASTTGTTGLTGTGPLGQRITICHHTHSKKHPFQTITINIHAWPAHARHHDTLGACTSAQTHTTTSTNRHHGHDKGHGAGNTSHNQGNGKGNGNHGNGNGQGQGGGHGHGHP